MRKLFVRSIIAMVLLACTTRAEAIGWDSNDFLIGGGSSFTSRIGVFDHDLTFKGYLDTNFVTVAGMDFDAQGRLVAVAGAMRSVRVYQPTNGAIVGGFTRQDDALGSAADLKLAPDGSYVIGTNNFGGGDGARRFQTDGSFVQQIGSGPIRAVAVVPGDKVWTGGIGTQHITVFDLASGTQTGTISIAGISSFRSMAFSQSTNSVLVASNASVWELDLSGNLIRPFHADTMGLGSVARGPGGDVVATAGGNVVRWSPDGTLIGTFPSGEVGTNGIVWAGNVPEPGGLCVVGACLLMFGQRTRRSAVGTRDSHLFCAALKSEK
ncbi:MAG: hypothetical protein H7Z14_01655 [Anaerolineae bacterium]|nr:hypothetical protein [Phycisphaerae bacterium]